MSFQNVDWTLAGGIIITGLVVVFIVLAFLWFAVGVIGKVGSVINAKTKAKTDANAEKAQLVNTVVPTAKLNGETIAAITGAIAAASGKNFKITSIKLSGSNTELFKG